MDKQRTEKKVLFGFLHNTDDIVCQKESGLTEVYCSLIHTRGVYDWSDIAVVRFSKFISIFCNFIEIVTLSSKFGVVFQNMKYLLKVTSARATNFRCLMYKCHMVTLLLVLCV